MEYSWDAPNWVREAIFYQIFPERFANGEPGNDPPDVVAWGSTPTRDNFFGGDLKGILDQLPYFEDLGITALYLTPIFKAKTNHKYDTNDYLAIDPAFGDKALFRRLVDSAHHRGMRIVLDAVFNHCGEGFWAFEDVRKKGAASQYTGWFFVDQFPVVESPPNYQTCGGTWYLPKLNTCNAEVQEYLLEVATYWIKEFGIDGWRLDVPWKACMDFWRLFRDRVKKANPEAYIVGEVWRDPRPWLRGDTCDGVMNYPLRNHILDYCLYDSMDAEDFNYEINLQREVMGPAWDYQLNLLGSHDTPRMLTVFQNDMERVTLALTLLFTSGGAPMIYYGDEIGLEGENDPDCRRSMPWDGSQWNQKLVQVYRKLIGARHRHLALQRGDFKPVLNFNGVYAYRRSHGDDEVIVVLNPREKRENLKIPLNEARSVKKSWRELMSGNVYPEADGVLLIESLASKSALVLLPI